MTLLLRRPHTGHAPEAEPAAESGTQRGGHPVPAGTAVGVPPASVHVAADPAARPQTRQFSDIMGTIVGFPNVDVEGDGSNALRLHFVDERRQSGGRVLDFEVLHGRAELAGITQVQARD
ncbi:hypothetical protein ABIE21_003644 [Conyzicola nivalis]|uniref:Uncharacterized protein n=1 Tax=Conyzicola nivalis TaxID=1477021 RepID=A0ABV2QSQ4_9MICO